MVNAGRIACISTPFVLSIASLICIILVFLAGTSKNNTSLDNIYFFQGDLSNFTADPSTDIIPGTNADNELLNTGLKQAKEDLKLKDIYQIYLWNYCAGATDKPYEYCSPKKAYFWFNPVEVWGLNNTGVEQLFPKELNNGLKTYQTVSKWMFIVYVISLITTILEIVVGISAIFSRWGSFATTFFSTASSLFTFAASLTATILFSTLSAAFNNALKPYGIHGKVGQTFLRITWLAVAFSFGAGFFWLLSVCCCSGRSPYGGKKDSKRVKVEKTPYTYERVGSPYLGPQQGGQNVPLTDLGPGKKASAYEPFREQGR